MGYRRRSWGWRTTWKRRGRQSKYERDNELTLYLLLLLGLFTCGLSWLGLIALAFRQEPRLKGLDTGCRSRGTTTPITFPPPPPAAPWPPEPAPAVEESPVSDGPPVRSTAWACEPRNLGGGHTVVTTQFRPCKSDDDQPT